MKKMRLDLLLIEQELFKSRSEAISAIMNGKVLVNDKIIIKAGTLVALTSKITVNINDQQFVSRGGEKLNKALTEFKINITNKICLDIGSSTGGFTDCMLQHGALKVYSVDVGTNQLVWQLRTHKQVIVLENTNFRYITKEIVPEPISFCAIDVSFISITKLIDALIPLLTPDAELVCLIKPQFETTRDNVESGGVVRNFKVHQNLLEELITFFISKKLEPWNLTFSPITGNKKGNIEYLLHLKYQEKSPLSAINVANIVLQAKEHFRKKN